MNLDLSKIKHVHFIGIGGIGISAIARMMMHFGKKVSGQDMNDGEIVESLRKSGIDINIGQSYEDVPQDADLVVYTIAIENYDRDLYKKLKERHDIPILSYPEMLHVVTEDKYTIAVCGTHGKTTTTGMIDKVLIDGGKDPTVVIGSLITDAKSGLKTNFIAGKSNLFVVEACEYKRSFLNINPNILVITNIEEDHLDYYKDIEDIKNAFRELALKVPSDGFVICNPNDKNIYDVIKDTKAKIINYDDFFDKDLKLKIPGVHNKKNAACAQALASIIPIPKDNTLKALSEFEGTWRRFEYKGKLGGGALVYDDYAHHPSEIVATLSGFRELYSRADGRVITVVFQPHLFSRTKLLLKEFSQSFNLADNVIILPIYYAREEDDGTMSAQILADEITKNNSNVKAFNDFKTAEDYLDSLSKTMDSRNIIVTMGAGEAFKVGDNLLNN